MVSRVIFNYAKGFFFFFMLRKNSKASVLRRRFPKWVLRRCVLMYEKKKNVTLHTHIPQPQPSALCGGRIHSCLSAAESKIVAPGRHGEPDISSLTASGSCHPTAVPAYLHNLSDSTACHRPGLLACCWADQPCVAATWRPIWQLTSITVTLSHSSFSGPHHKHDL